MTRLEPSARYSQVITVADDIEIELPKAPSDQPWFFDWYRRSPGEVVKHLQAGWIAYQSLRELEINSATEYFGGIGAQSMMIRKLWDPDRHYVFDFNPQAAEHLRNLLPPPVAAWRANSYDLATFRKADLVGLDFGDLTCWRTREGEPHRALLDRVFASDPKAVVLTDIAGPRLHLQRERYETLLGEGTCATYESYLRAFLNRINALYGYSAAGGAYHRWSTVVALTPGEETSFPKPLADYDVVR